MDVYTLTMTEEEMLIVAIAIKNATIPASAAPEMASFIAKFNVLATPKKPNGKATELPPGPPEPKEPNGEAPGRFPPKPQDQPAHGTR